MKYSHFYTVDQWELQDMDDQWYPEDKKRMCHKPCDHIVCKAITGTRWACTGCYTEPPEEIMDVIFLSGAYKGWVDSEPYEDPWSTGSFYLKPKILGSTISIESDMFYWNYLTDASTFYIGGGGTYFKENNGTNWTFGGAGDLISQHIGNLRDKVRNSVFKQITDQIDPDDNWDDDEYWENWGEDDKGY